MFEANKADSNKILSQKALAAEEVPHFSEFPVNMVHGEQMIGKYKEADAKSNTVGMRVVVIRLRHAETDIVVTLNTPVKFAEGGASDNSNAQALPEEENEAVFQSVLKSFKLNDWGLFGVDPPPSTKAAKEVAAKADAEVPASLVDEMAKATISTPSE